MHLTVSISLLFSLSSSLQWEDVLFVMFFCSTWLMEVVRLRLGLISVLFDLASHELPGNLPLSRCNGAKVVAFARILNFSSEFFANNALVVVCLDKVGHDSQS